MSYRYHRCEIDEKGTRKEDFITFNVRVDDHNFSFTLSDSEVEMARRNTDSFCNFLDNLLSRISGDLIDGR